LDHLDKILELVDETEMAEVNVNVAFVEEARWMLDNPLVWEVLVRIHHHLKC
jgi:hypothetical protein